LHLDDYEINESLSHLAVSVPIVPGRLNDLLRHCGMGVISKNNIAATKAEVEPLFADRAQDSMAVARDRDVFLNRDEPEPAVCTDTAWDHGRNGENATTIFISCTTGRVVHEEATRRSDILIKSSQVLPRPAPVEYTMAP
jgi:hypothetical protein